MVLCSFLIFFYIYYPHYTNIQIPYTTYHFSEVSNEADISVKKDTTTKGGKRNPSPMTPLKSIGGAHVQVLKIDDLRMFCSRNGIKGSRKAKKAHVCWAICKAKAKHLAGDPGPYKDLIPETNNRPSYNGADMLLGEAFGTATDSSGRKRNRVDEVTHGTVMPPLAKVAKLSGSSSDEYMALQRRLVRSKELANLSIERREAIESVALLRSEIRAEKDRRDSLWKALIDNVGDEHEALERVKVFKSEKTMNTVDTLIGNVMEQDELLSRMAIQFKQLSKEVDRLLPQQEEQGNDGKDLLQHEKINDGKDEEVTTAI